MFKRAKFKDFDKRDLEAFRNDLTKCKNTLKPWNKFHIQPELNLDKRNSNFIYKDYFTATS